MLPTRGEAERLLEEAYQMNPGPWSDHSRMVARCAERIARVCPGMGPGKAYVLGLLHDIGRREGVTSMRHVTDGYHFLKRLGYGEAARICVTHSFAVKDIQFYIGKVDVTEAEYREIEGLLAGYEYDDYDRLIQLCDSLAMADGTINLKARMDDVERRHGYFPEEKRQAHYRLKETFDEKAGMDLYPVLRASEERV